MIKFDTPQVAAEFEDAFGGVLTKQQAWWIVKVAKHVRGRCRNNQALVNYMNRNFPHLRFSIVPKGDYNATVIEEMSNVG